MLVTRAGDLALEIAAGLSVCLSVWAVRDVSTPNVGSGVEAQLVENGLGRDYARRCAMVGILHDSPASKTLPSHHGRVRIHGDLARDHHG